MWLFQWYGFLGGSGKSDRRSLQRFAKYENNRTWQDVFNRTVNLAVDLFEWSGLPPTVDPYFLELQLLFMAESCIVYDESFASYLNLMTTPAGRKNLQYQSAYYRAYSLNYSKRFMALTQYNKTIFDAMLELTGGPEEVPMRGVVCQDNALVYPIVETIELYTTRKVNAMRALDVLQKQAKLPSIVETDEDTKMSIQEAINDIDENVMAIYVGKNVAQALRESKSIQTQFNPAVIDVMWNHLNNLRSEELTALGINNLNTADKKERLLTDEINSNNQSIAYNIGYRLDFRKRFCSNLNSVFGMNAAVNLKHRVEAENVGPQSLGVKNGDAENIR